MFEDDVDKINKYMNQAKWAQPLLGSNWIAHLSQL